MRRATLKSLLAHKLRLALTAIAVVLGVAFISGTLVLTDTLNATFTNVFGDAYRNVDVAVRAKSAFGTGDDREPVPAALLPTVRGVDGVRGAAGTIDGDAQLVDPKTGKAVTTGGAPTLGTTWTAPPPRRSGWPTGAVRRLPARPPSTRSPLRSTISRSGRPFACCCMVDQADRCRDLPAEPAGRLLSALHRHLLNVTSPVSSTVSYS